jgi:DNA-binding NarL/FixJ family response regulator
MTQIMIDGKEVTFSKRDLEVISLLARGCDNAEIAKELGIATRTVKAHLHVIFIRCQITTGYKRIKLATMAYKSKLL